MHVNAYFSPENIAERNLIGQQKNENISNRSICQMDRIVWYKCAANGIQTTKNILWLRHLLASQLYEFSKNPKYKIPNLTWSDSIRYLTQNNIYKQPAKFPYIGYGKYLHRLVQKYWKSGNFRSHSHNYPTLRLGRCYHYLLRYGNLKAIDKLRGLIEWNLCNGKQYSFNYIIVLLHAYLYNHIHIIQHLYNFIRTTRSDGSTIDDIHNLHIIAYKKCLKFNSIQSLKYILHTFTPDVNIKDIITGHVNTKYFGMHHSLYRKYGHTWLDKINIYRGSEINLLSGQYKLLYRLDPAYLSNKDVNMFFEPLIAPVIDTSLLAAHTGIYNGNKPLETREIKASYKVCRHMMRHYTIKYIRGPEVYTRIISAGLLKNLRLVMRILPHPKHVLNYCAMYTNEHTEMIRFLMQTAIRFKRSEILQYLMRFKPHPIYTAITTNDVAAIQDWMANNKTVPLCSHYLTLACETHRLHLLPILSKHPNIVW